ncbi:MAG: hypothetical protein ACOX4U_01560 [Anaerovoracaceae bacterium]|jgi:flagellar hook-associated protein 3 FlgL
MRVTHKMMTSKYIRSVNDLSSGLNKLNDQIITGRAFAKSSENTAAAIKAFQIRRDLIRTEGYQANISHAQSSLRNSESSLHHIGELVQIAKDRVIQSNTGTVSIDERRIVAKELKSIQESLIQSLNSNDSNAFYFGGTNTDVNPFTLMIDPLDGKERLAYNGVLLNSIDDAQKEILSHEAMYVDIGLGVRTISVLVDPGNPTGPTKDIIDPGTVFHYTIPGINITGNGTITTSNGETISANVYDLIGTIADKLSSDSYSYDEVDELYGILQEASMNVIYNITEIGSKVSYLEFIEDRYEVRTLDQQERQLEIEGADPAEVIIHFKSQQVAYNAALQMGAKIIPPSIFNFMS